MRDVVARMRAGSPLLWWSGIACIVISVVFLLMAAIDPVTITGVRRWIKPSKFAISFIFYFWTLAWMLQLLQLPNRIRAVVAALAVLIMAAELGAIAMQAGRGVTSHFNNSTVFDALVYAGMGLAISANTIMLALLALYASFRWPRAHDVTRAGVVAGLWLIVLGSVCGILISVNGAHAVGAADDALGLPLVGWSRSGGDLRVAHFFGLHGFQLAPIVAALTRRVSLVYIASALWAVLVVALYSMAQSGRAVWPA